MQTQFPVPTQGQGLYEITRPVADWIAGQPDGLLTLLIRHTSASLLIQENADPDVQTDLLAFYQRLVPAADDPSMSYLRHRMEGPDDMPAHVRTALTACNLSIPITDGRLGLGTWQGVYLWEHREHGTSRRLTLTVEGA